MTNGNEIIAKKTEKENKDDDLDSIGDEVASERQLASYTQIFSFASEKGTKLKMGFACFFALFTGMSFPAAGFFFADSLEKLSGSPETEEFITEITNVSYAFMIIGVTIFFSMTAQSALMETAADEMTQGLKKAWFEALLRQDMAYYDIMDAAADGATITSNGARYRKGVGRKLADVIQYVVTFSGAMAYCFYSSWQVTLAALTVSPLMYVTTVWLIKLNTTQSSQTNKAYAKAGSIATTSISSVRTILSLNAVERTIGHYTDATKLACDKAIGNTWKMGLANGTEIGSFMLSYIIVTLLGSYLLYDNVKETGCDPSGTIEDNVRCKPAGKDVLGVMVGIEFAAAVIPMIAISLEALTEARVACFPAFEVINRKRKEKTEADDAEENQNPQNPQSPEVVLDNTTSGSSDNDNDCNAISSKKETSTFTQLRPKLPEYRIDSTSSLGIQPASIIGAIEFQGVSFAFPTRRKIQVLRNFSFKIEAGKTVALVGKSGSGKSTVIQLLERFYDPLRGRVTLDGVDLRDINVEWLRQEIGLVQQEPKLFAASVRDNIAAGALNKNLTQEQIETAAKMANAHEFILSFPNGYDTPVGDAGAQLSGGQKQRIAIARALVKQPKVLLLDEATSALDSESEATVQQALDHLMKLKNMTTFVIAHRLSTIKNADVIAVMNEGKIAEFGSHDELLLQKSLYFNLVEAQKGKESLDEEDENEDEIRDILETCSTNGTDCEGVNIVYDPSKENPKESPIPNDKAGNKTHVQFTNVHFEYPTRPDNPVLKGLDLSIKSGETLALVGPSGCGKSTMIQLMECFYRPSEGTVHYNGIDMLHLNVKWLRSELGLVSQEPVLFDTTIEENIRYGCVEASREEIIDAAKKANAHDFIMGFPNRYNTRVGAGSTLVSGGQKQRIAIARALLSNPKLLLLDEATSALDSESERIVHKTLDKIMSSDEHTVIVIAHRLSTIQSADRIAFIDNGVVAEIGTHYELMVLPDGRYRRYHRILKKGLKDESNTPLVEKKEEISEENDTHDDDDSEVEIAESVELRSAFKLAARARRLASDDALFFFFGSIGAIFAGLMFPGIGVVFAFMLELFYMEVEKCPAVLDELEFDTCPDYWNSIALDMEYRSYDVFYGFLFILFLTVTGFWLVFWGFGNASQRLNKRVRDAAFQSLLCQEVGWFDLQSTGELASQLSDDAAMMHAFCGEPIRTLLLNMSSVAVGLFVSFFFMWPFALLTMAILPFMAFGAEMEERMYGGEDEGDANEFDDSVGSPGGIVIETLSNIRTIASLTLEKDQMAKYAEALHWEKPFPFLSNLKKGCLFGVGQFIQMWGLALVFFWGGWLIHTYPDRYTYRDYIISMGSLLISLYGLVVAAQGAVNREKAIKAADRIFRLIDRQSQIDPLSEAGIKEDGLDSFPNVKNKLDFAGTWDEEVPTNGYSEVPIQEGYKDEMV